MKGDKAKQKLNAVKRAKPVFVIKETQEPFSVIIREDKAFYLRQIVTVINELKPIKSLNDKDIKNQANEIYKLLFRCDKDKKYLTQKEIFEYWDQLEDVFRSAQYLMEDAPDEILNLLPTGITKEWKEKILELRTLFSNAKKDNPYLEEKVVALARRSRIYKGKGRNEYAEFLSNKLGEIFFFLTGKEPKRISFKDFSKKSGYRNTGSIEKGEYHDFLKKIFAIGGLKLSAASQAKSSARKFKSMELRT